MGLLWIILILCCDIFMVFIIEFRLMLNIWWFILNIMMWFIDMVCGRISLNWVFLLILFCILMVLFVCVIMVCIVFIFILCFDKLDICLLVEKLVVKISCSDFFLVSVLSWCFWMIFFWYVSIFIFLVLMFLLLLWILIIILLFWGMVFSIMVLVLDLFVVLWFDGVLMLWLILLCNRWISGFDKDLIRFLLNLVFLFCIIRLIFLLSFLVNFFINWG